MQPSKSQLFLQVCDLEEVELLESNSSYDELDL